MSGARAAIAAAAARFGFSATPRLDAELLLAHALGIDRSALLLDRDRAVPERFAALVDRRAAGEPVAYITGRRGFWTIDLAVAPGALIPRADSETLIEAAAAHWGKGGPRTMLDLGTGPGTLLLAALAQWPGARGVGVDRSAVALRQAKGNADALGLGPRAAWLRGDWAAALAGSFDLVLANPPYVATNEALPQEVAAFEPAEALFGGADGLDAYRAIVPALPALLAPGGLAAIEIGWTQAAAVSALVREIGLGVVIHRDLGGRERCLAVTA